MPSKLTTIYDFHQGAFDSSTIPDFDTQFIHEKDIEQFAKALNASESSSVTALNDWRPVRQRVKPKRPRSYKKPRRTTDETREGFVYTILKWPLLLLVVNWVLVLAFAYLITRTYVWAYERLITWRGQRQRLRQDVRSKTSYEAWHAAASELDLHLGNEQWKKTDDYAYYNSATVKKVNVQLKSSRKRAMSLELIEGDSHCKALSELRGLVEACVQNNFVGVENPRLYSETYYGTKYLAQQFIDELYASLAYLLYSPKLSDSDKYSLSKQLHKNFGRSALFLSGGASFAYYHFGIAKALLDASLLPDVITGTSGGALVAALIATRTNDELRKLLVPALANHINACKDGFLTWAPRWWRTGARFDSLEWARQCSWFSRGNTTFQEAYERTGRILNVSCVPSDPHSPSILTNLSSTPDVVIWSAVLASAAVPGILNPVVLMKKLPDGTLGPYSFGHKWKDGSLRTDIPLKALNLHFGVNFSIVSQVNPHINLFFFSSRGTVGRPVTHRRGRGWRGGFLGSAIEKYLQLELQKFLKISKHLELLPRPLGQDWSLIWLQQFSGTITIWPKTLLSDFWYILSDPSPERLASMLVMGQQSTFPKILFIQNRMKIERLIEEGLLLGGSGKIDMERVLIKGRESMHVHGQAMRQSAVSTVYKRAEFDRQGREPRPSSVIQEIKRQSSVFFDDSELDGEDTGGSEDEISALGCARERESDRHG